jgi:hypothetical protein
MTKTIPMAHREERRALSKLLIELSHVTLHAYKEGHSEKAGYDGARLLVAAAVIVGHADNKPMNASKISHYLELPRTTVLRKLDELIAAGAVERYGGSSFILADKRASNQAADVARMVSVFNKTKDEMERNRP